MVTKWVDGFHGDSTDPDMIQLLVGLHQLFLQFDNLQHRFILYIQQALRHLWTGREIDG